MESLPVELVRLIYEFCGLESIKALRLQSRVFAAVGLDYLIGDTIHVLGWQVDRLHSISAHDQLNSRIQSLTLNFAEVDEYTARHASFFQHYLQEPEERNERLTAAWTQYYEADKRRQAAPPFASRSELVLQSFRNLASLRHLEVTFTQCPFAIDVLDDVFKGLPSSRKMDRDQAAKNMAVIASALKESTHLSSLTIDRFPLEILRLPDERRRWIDCATSAFANLTALNLTIDPSALKLPAQRFKAIKGLGSILRCATNLTHLTLAFHTYGMPKHKFILWFDTLLERSFTFPRLTDLKLEGLSCDEDDLRAFLLRHAATLQRLRLGGRGLGTGLGGLHLCRGTFRGLFASLRGGRLPRLQRCHFEGDFECVGVERSANEAYSFHGVTDDNWDDIVSLHAEDGGDENENDSGQRRRSISATTGARAGTRDGREFERYLLLGGRYPGSPSTSPAPVPAPVPASASASAAVSTVPLPAPAPVVVAAAQ